MLSLLFLLSFVLFSSASLISSCPAPAPDWTNLTPSSLAALAPCAVADATAMDLASIPTPACTGWNSTQLSAIGSGVDPSASRGLSAACVSLIPPVAFSGSTALFIASLNTSVLSIINGDQLGNISASSLVSLSAAQFASLQPSVCGYFTSVQLLYVTSTDALGHPFMSMTTDCWLSLPLSALSGIGPAGISVLSPAIISLWSPITLEHLNSFSFTGLNASQIAHFPTNICPNITAHQLTMLSLPGSGFGCSGFQAACFSLLTPQSIHMISHSCVAYLSLPVISALLPTQVSAMNNLAFCSISSIQSSYFTNITCQALLPSQTFFLNIDAVPGLSEQCFHSMSLDTIHGFQSGIRLVSPTIIGTFTSAMIGAISETDVLTMDQVGSIHSACSGFSAYQLNHLDRQYACALMTPECVESISLDALPKIFIKCLSSIPPASFLAFSSSALSVLGKSNLLSALTADQLGVYIHRYSRWSIASPSLGWPAEAVNQISFDTFSTLEPILITPLIDVFNSSTDWSSVNGLQLNAASSASMALLFSNSSWVNQIPMESWRGLGAQQLDFIGPFNSSSAEAAGSIAQLLQPAAFSYWSIGTIYALSPFQVAVLNPLASVDFPLYALSIKSLPQFPTANLLHLKASDIAQLTCDQVVILQSAQLNTLYDNYPWTRNYFSDCQFPANTTILTPYSSSSSTGGSVSSSPSQCPPSFDSDRDSDGQLHSFQIIAYVSLSLLVSLILLLLLIWIRYRSIIRSSILQQNQLNSSNVTTDLSTPLLIQ